MLREPLLNKRVVDKRLAVAPIPPAHAQALHRWADSIRDGSITAHKETGIRRPFLQMLFACQRIARDPSRSR
ncbi:MAG: hypothetical protein M3R20_05705 [Pseudomonadota bacterium]|nr:hypothetical protein [Pseudomonadota bacterium]